MNHYNRNAQNKAFELSLKLIQHCRELQLTQKEYVLSRQLLKSGTSVGANLEEAVGSQSDKEIYTKIHIAYREARESKYWVKLLSASDLLEKPDSEDLLKRIEELLRILGASISTLKKKLNK